MSKVKSLVKNEIVNCQNTHSIYSSHLSLLTAESVGIGHPDKICDQIADAILDACLTQDPNSHVACEIFASNRLIVIGGEITTKAKINVIDITWNLLSKLGYKKDDFEIYSNINNQSVEIANLVSHKKNKLGAGDIGVVFGYATNENKDYLPTPYVLATRFIKGINDATFNHQLKGALYDSKCQVSVYYDEEMNPIGIDNVIISLQHKKDADLKKLTSLITKNILIPIANEYELNTDFEVLLNQNGSFVVGGPFGDTGLTGRKLMVDTYGSLAKHGGGAFSGKDYTKVDRTGAYMARYIAKNLVAANVADRIEIQMAFNIGTEKPLTLYINTFNTEKIPLAKIYQIVDEIFNLSLINIVAKFDMRHIKYSDFSVYGHFGKFNCAKPWEELDKVDEIKKLI